MKEIPLTQGKVALVDDADFDRVNAFKWYAKFEHGKWYATRHFRLNGKRYTLRLHRLIMGLDFGDPLQVDHRDRVNTLDNRRSNLRVTLDQNQQNVGLNCRNTSGYKGVHWNKRVEKWQARARVNNVLQHFGYFSNPELAAHAYAAAIGYRGEFAVLNFPDVHEAALGVAA